jgi:transposase
MLMSVPGVGAIVSLTFAAAIDDPGGFKSSKQVGPNFGLTPTKYPSGETDIDGRISTSVMHGCAPLFTRPPTSF